MSNKLASESDIKKIQQDIKDLVDESIKFAEESPELEPHELYEDVYMQKDYPFIKD
jgi:pyruvate dehydrogenase E1 component alpha subunit